jgi:hypothetical protein
LTASPTTKTTIVSTTTVSSTVTTTATSVACALRVQGGAFSGMYLADTGSSMPFVYATNNISQAGSWALTDDNSFLVMDGQLASVDSTRWNNLYVGNQYIDDTHVTLRCAFPGSNSSLVCENSADNSPGSFTINDNHSDALYVIYASNVQYARQNPFGPLITLVRDCAPLG